MEFNQSRKPPSFRRRDGYDDSYRYQPSGRYHQQQRSYRVTSGVQSDSAPREEEDYWDRKPEYERDRDRKPEAQGGYVSEKKFSYASKLDRDSKLEKYYEQPVKSTPEIEVSPGEYLPLRGADETWRCIHVDFYMPCECIACESTIFCIQDAQFVLCPLCKTVCPMEGDKGVGLGFTVDDLAKWQQDIQYERKAMVKKNKY